jgi:hypothetical protein
MLQSDQPLNVQQRAQLLSQGQGQPEQGRRGPDQQMEIERQQHREEREEEEPVALIGRKRKRLKKNKKLIANNMKKFNHEIETSINEQAKLVKEADKKIETTKNNLNLQKKELKKSIQRHALARGSQGNPKDPFTINPTRLEQGVYFHTGDFTFSDKLHTICTKDVWLAYLAVYNVSRARTLPERDIFRDENGSLLLKKQKQSDVLLTPKVLVHNTYTENENKADTCDVLNLSKISTVTAALSAKPVKEEVAYRQFTILDPNINRVVPPHMFRRLSKKKQKITKIELFEYDKRRLYACFMEDDELPLQIDINNLIILDFTTLSRGFVADNTGQMHLTSEILKGLDGYGTKNVFIKSIKTPNDLKGIRDIDFFKETPFANESSQVSVMSFDPTRLSNSFMYCRDINDDDLVNYEYFRLNLKLTTSLTNMYMTCARSRDTDPEPYYYQNFIVNSLPVNLLQYSDALYSLSEGCFPFIGQPDLTRDISTTATSYPAYFNVIDRITANLSRLSIILDKSLEYSTLPVKYLTRILKVSKRIQMDDNLFNTSLYPHINVTYMNSIIDKGPIHRIHIYLTDNRRQTVIQNVASLNEIATNITKNYIHNKETKDIEFADIKRLVESITTFTSELFPTSFSTLCPNIAYDKSFALAITNNVANLVEATNNVTKIRVGNSLNVAIKDLGEQISIRQDALKIITKQINGMIESNNAKRATVGSIATDNINLQLNTSKTKTETGLSNLTKIQTILTNINAGTTKDELFNLREQISPYLAGAEDVLTSLDKIINLK